jgi:hypothetical protein
LPFALDDGGEPRLVERLVGLESHVAAVVQHPDVLMAPAMLAPLGRQLVLENMDVRKPGRDVAELEPYFRVLPEAGLCLDVAHAKTIDPELKVAHELLGVFGTRLRELHLSGIDERGTFRSTPTPSTRLPTFFGAAVGCRGSWSRYLSTRGETSPRRVPGWRLRRCRRRSPRQAGATEAR